MRAGSLNKKVTFQEEYRTDDGMGGSDREWVDMATVWAHYMPERGRERLEAGRLEAALAGVLHIRSSVNSRLITEAHTVLIDGERFQIRSISNPDQRRRLIEMTVEKNVAT